MTEQGDKSQTIGDFQFGLDSPETMARFTESLYRDIEPLRDLGTVPPDLTYWEIGDAILDTIANYAGMEAIPATELGTLIMDALEQLSDSGSGPQFSEA